MNHGSISQKRDLHGANDFLPANSHLPFLDFNPADNRAQTFFKRNLEAKGGVEKF